MCLKSEYNGILFYQLGVLALPFLDVFSFFPMQLIHPTSGQMTIIFRL